MLQAHITKTHSEREDTTFIYNVAWCKINKYKEKLIKMKFNILRTSANTHKP
jgi:hypothetical protein